MEGLAQILSMLPVGVQTERAGRQARPAGNLTSSAAQCKQEQESSNSDVESAAGCGARNARGCWRATLARREPLHCEDTRLRTDGQHSNRRLFGRARG